MTNTRLTVNKSDIFPANENQIFVGKISSSPAVGKMFAKRTEYLMVVEEVKKAIEFLGLSNPNKYKTTAILVLKGHVEVEIAEREECVFLSVCFKGDKATTGFLGLTDIKGIGYTKFLESYKEQSPILISLICNETHEETLIFGVKNVRVAKLNDLADEL